MSHLVCLHGFVNLLIKLSDTLTDVFLGLVLYLCDHFQAFTLECHQLATKAKAGTAPRN